MMSNNSVLLKKSTQIGFYLTNSYPRIYFRLEFKLIYSSKNIQEKKWLFLKNGYF